MIHTYYEPITYVVKQEESGWMLKDVLQKRLRVSRKLLSRIKLTDRGITVNGVRQYISVRVQPGDLVEIRMERETSEDILPQPMPLDILFEDEQLLIVHKPAGVIVHPTHGHYVNTLANGVVHYWQSRGKQYRFRPVHRLDQETSGVLAIAKNPYAHQHISEQMIAGKVEKEYIACLHGILQPVKGTVNSPIDRDPKEPHKRIVTPDGYGAVTHYSVDRAFAHATKAKLWLETGRTHQIRVHMQALGHPLIGDKLYGYSSNALSAVALALEACIARHALHAASLSFHHPITNERMRFVAPLPDDMQRLEQAMLDNTTKRSHRHEADGI